MKRIALVFLFLFFTTTQVFAAGRFWVGGSGDWDAVTTTHWSDTSGGAGGFSVPGPGDSVVFDNNSTGIVTVNFGGTITIDTLAWANGYTGTWTNAVNNNNITATAGGIAGTGSGARNINLGAATYTVGGVNAAWDFNLTTGLTFSGASSTIVFTALTGTKTFRGGDLAYGTVTLSPSTLSSASFVSIQGANTFNTLIINQPNYVQFPATFTTTIGTLTITGTTANPVTIVTNNTPTTSSSATLAITTASITGVALRDIIFTGSPIATNCIDLGHTSGITCNLPGGTTACILGGWLLWRDMPEHLNDNFPAWLDKAA